MSDDSEQEALKRTGRRGKTTLIDDSESSSEGSFEQHKKRKRVLKVNSDSEDAASSDSPILNARKKRPHQVMSESEDSDDLKSSESEGSSDEDEGEGSSSSLETEGGEEEEEEEEGSEYGSSSFSEWESEEEVEETETVAVQSASKSEPKVSDVGAASSSSQPAGAAGYSSDSSDGQSEKCPICLLTFTTQEVGTPESCDHSFCADCLQEWSKNVNTCPVDRQIFTLILVRRCLEGKVIRRIPIEAPRRQDEEEIQEDPTYCEVCGECDREDRMLLCDGCDLGYHLECLDPPLDTVPLEEWFCPDCILSNSVQLAEEVDIQDGELTALIEDASAIGLPPLRPRVSRLLPRTRQSERVRATMRTRQRQREGGQQVDVLAQPSTSSGFDSLEADSNASAPRTVRRRNATSGTRTIRKRRKTVRKSTKRKKKKLKTNTKKRKVTRISSKGKVEASKKRHKKWRKIKKKKRKTISRRVRRPARVIVPLSVKGRLAEHLGVCPPRRPGQTIPDVRPRITTSRIDFQRSRAGIPTLHLFGQRDQLDYFSSGSDHDDGGEPDGSVAVVARPRTAVGNLRNLINRKQVSLSRPLRSIPVPSNDSGNTGTGTCDLIGSILDSQAVWHSKKTLATINRDGSLQIRSGTPKRNTENSDTKHSDSNRSDNGVTVRTDDRLSQISNTSAPVNISEAGSSMSNHVTQAPMYPGRSGGSGTRPPPGGSFHQFSGARYSGSPSYHGYQGGRGYSSFPPPSTFDSRGSRAGYANYLNSGPPPPPPPPLPPFRGNLLRFRMTPPRLPFRRPPAPSPRPQQGPPSSTMEFHPVDDIDDTLEDQKQVTKPVDEEEEIDIYSDIEVGGGSNSGGAGGAEPDDSDRGMELSYEALPPPPVPPAMLMSMSDEEPESDNELVIDDNVTPSTPENINEEPTKPEIPESEKYDPAEPSNDTDEEEEALAKANVAAPATVVLSTSSGPCPVTSQSSNSNASYLHSPTYGESSGLMTDLKIPSLSSEIPIPKLETLVRDEDALERHSSNEEDEEEEEEEEECPNFSIYSAASMDIARRTTTKEEDKIENDETEIETKTEEEVNVETSKEEECASPFEEKDEISNASAAEDTAVHEDKPKDHDNMPPEKDSKTEDEAEESDEDDKNKDEFPEADASTLVIEEILETEKKDGEEIEEEEDNGNIAEESEHANDDSEEKPEAAVAVEGMKKISLVEEIFGSDDDSLIGGATSAVSAATVDNTLQTAVTPVGLEGLDTETISETEEAINFEDDLSQDDGFLTAEEDGEIPSGKKKKKKKNRKSSFSGSACEEGGTGKDQDAIDYEEGEIVDDRPKQHDGLKKDKKLQEKKDKSKYDKDVQKSGDENFDITGKSKPSATDEERKKKKKKSSEKARGSKERIVLGSSENKERNKDKADDGNIAWKKPSKSTKERNYRDTKAKGDTDPNKAKEAAKKKEEPTGKKEKKKKEKRKDMERYDVRKVVGDKKRKRRDAFGRDLSRERSISKSRSRSRGRSYDRIHGRSRSLSRPRITRSRGRSPVKSRVRSRSRSRPRSRSRSRLRSRSRSKTRSKVKSKDRSRKSRSKERLRSRVSRSRSRGRRSRSRSHSRSRNRSRLRSRSRSPRRSKDRKEKSRDVRSSQRCRYRERRSWSHSWTPSWSRSRSVSYSSYSRSRSPTPRRYNRSYSRSFSRSWSRERHERIPVIEKKSISKTAKKLTVIVPNTKDDSERQRKKEKKRKEAKKSKEALLSVEKRKKRKEKSPAPSKEVFTSGDNILVSVNFNKSNKSTSSKDVSTSSIPIISKETSKRKQHDESFEMERESVKKIRKDKGSKEKSSPRQKNGSVNIEKVMVRSSEKKLKKVAQKVNAKTSRVAQLVNKKPVAIIDLDQSPFHEQTPSPRDLIVLSDSEDEGMNKDGDREELVESLNSLRSMRSRSPSPKSSSKQGPPPGSSLARTPEPESPAPVVNYLVTSTGPKTPPEPQIKFSIASKPQLRSISNPLREDEEDMMAEDGGLDDLDQRIEEELDRELDRDRGLGEMMHKGPNTPPEPRGPTTPCSPPTSPDAYDPFDPTKSGTPSPVGAGVSMDGPPSPAHTPPEQMMQMNVMSRESPVVSDLEDLASKSLEARAITPTLVSTEEPVDQSSQSPERTKLSVRVDTVLATSPSIMPETTALPPAVSSDNEASQPLELAEASDKPKQISLGLPPSATSASIADTNVSQSPERNISVVINTQTQNLQGTPVKQPTFPNNSLKVTASQQPITSTPTHSTAPAPVFPSLTPANIASILCTPPPSALPLSRMALFNPSAIPVSQMMAQQQQPQQQQHMLSSPVIIQQRPPPAIVRTTPEKLVAPPTPAKLPTRANTIQNGEQTQPTQKQPPDISTDVVDMDLESPYSPGSSEGDDLFEPPSEVKSVTPSSSYNTINERNRSLPLPNKNANKLPPPLAAILHKSPSKPPAANQDKFDSLFVLSPLRGNKSAPRGATGRHTPKSHHSKSTKPKSGKHDKSKGGKKEIAIKMDEDQLQILDDLPSSAVELQVKDKFLKKLNRQERVVEEVKLSLKPHYTKKHITKEEYKEILRRSVPKICHNKSGEINPIKISSLVEAYVKKYRYAKKKNAVAGKAKVSKTTMWS